MDIKVVKPEPQPEPEAKIVLELSYAEALDLCKIADTIDGGHDKYQTAYQVWDKLGDACAEAKGMGFWEWEQQVRERDNLSHS